jgi:hypothetical protein
MVVVNDRNIQLYLNKEGVCVGQTVNDLLLKIYTRNQYSLKCEFSVSVQIFIASTIKIKHKKLQARDVYIKYSRLVNYFIWQGKVISIV